MSFQQMTPDQLREEITKRKHAITGQVKVLRQFESKVRGINDLINRTMARLEEAEFYLEKHNEHE